MAPAVDLAPRLAQQPPRQIAVPAVRLTPEQREYLCRQVETALAFARYAAPDAGVHHVEASIDFGGDPPMLVEALPVRRHRRGSGR